MSHWCNPMWSSNTEFSSSTFQKDPGCLFQTHICASFYFFSTSSVKVGCGHEFQCASGFLHIGICTQGIVLLLVWPPDASQSPSRWLQHGLQWAPSSDLCVVVGLPCSVPAGNDVTHKLTLKSYLKFKIEMKVFASDSNVILSTWFFFMY